MGLLFSVVMLTIGAGDAQSYLVRTGKTLEMFRADLPGMQPLADKAAAALVKGGKLFAAGQASLVSEITGRAGGLMMIRPLGSVTPGADDVVLYAHEPGGAMPPALKDTRALVVAFVSKTDDAPFPVFVNHFDAFVLSPTLANALAAWVFTGELVAALTRLGKMPVVYETIGMYGGMARIDQYKNGAVAFHEDMTVAPVAPGVIGEEFISRVGAMLLRVDTDDRAKLDKVGAWAREAKAAGRQLFMYSMGHLFPDEVGKTDIGKTFKSAVWNAGFRTSPAPNDTYEPGDLAVSIGYQHPATELVKRTRHADARAVYVTVMGHRDDVESADTIWIDPMWDWQDACVPVPGYDVPLLPASGIVNGAIAWEIYRLSTPAP